MTDTVMDVSNKGVELGKQGFDMAKDGTTKVTDVGMKGFEATKDLAGKATDTVSKPLGDVANATVMKIPGADAVKEAGEKATSMTMDSDATMTPTSSSQSPSVRPPCPPPLPAAACSCTSTVTCGSGRAVPWLMLLLGAGVADVAPVSGPAVKTTTMLVGGGVVVAGHVRECAPTGCGCDRIAIAGGAR